MTGTTSASGLMRRMPTSIRPASPRFMCSIARPIQSPRSGQPAAAHDLWVGSLSRDGNRIVFQSDQNLDSSPDDSNGGTIRYFCLRPHAQYDPARVRRPRRRSGERRQHSPQHQSDGNFVTFASNASNLVPGDTNGQPDTFVKNLQTGVIERVSVAVDGTQGNGDSSLASAISGGGHGDFRCFRECGIEPRAGRHQRSVGYFRP